MKGIGMKKLTICFLALTGCGSFVTENGAFKGRLVDVKWGGVIFKSCEAEFQFGENSSKSSKGSSIDQGFCDELKKHVGEIVQVKYRTWARPCCLRADTVYEIYKLNTDKSRHSKVMCAG